MSKKIVLEETRQEELTWVKGIYEQLFPEIERKPFPLMQQLVAQQKAIMLTVRDAESGEAVGMNFLLLHEDMILFDYFAIAPEYQSMGYGTDVLRVVADRYPYKRIFGEVEPLDDAAPNAKQRKRRMDFYLSNGVKSTGIIIDLFGCILQVMYMGDTPVTYEEYENFQRAIMGDEMTRKNVHFLRQEPV